MFPCFRLPQGGGIDLNRPLNHDHAPGGGSVNRRYLI
jgi:hypothetical protein